MAPKSQKSSSRINSKTSLTKAIELIASEQIRDTSRKPVKISYKINPAAAKILVRITSRDVMRGWQVLRGCDAMSIYGSQIPIAFEGYCNGDDEVFVFFASQIKEDMARYVDKQKDVVIHDQNPSDGRSELDGSVPF